MKIIPFIFLTAIHLFPVAAGAPQRVVEEVAVKRVVVQVRVLDAASRPVRGLQAADFQLFEGGKLQKLEQCLPMEKKIDVHDVTFSPATSQARFPRYFVLIFQIADLPSSLREGIDFLFERMLQPMDDLLLMINHRIFFLDASVGDLLRRRQILLGHLEEQAARYRDLIQQYSARVHRSLPRHELDKLKDDNFHFNPVVTEYIRHYYLTMQQYIREILAPDTYRYYQLAYYLSQVPKEKWVINFVQKDLLPKSKTADTSIQHIRRYLHQEGLDDRTFGSEGEDIFVKNIGGLLSQIDDLFQHPPSFFTRKVSTLFTRTRSTFFTLFFKGEEVRGNGGGGLQDLSSIIQKQFSELTRKSGGMTLSTSQIASALHRFSQIRDYHYLLVYSPTDFDRVGRIDIRLSDPDFDIIYDPRQRSDHISEFLNHPDRSAGGIRLSDVQFSDEKLRFSVTRFAGFQETRRARIQLRILIKNTDNQAVFNETKVMTARKERVDIRIDFPWLEDRSYFLILEARDLLSLENDLFFSEIRGR